MIKDQIYLIKWRDHYSMEGFFDKNLSDLNDVIMELETVGFFVSEDKHYYHFVRTMNNDMYADSMSIIKKQIIDIKELE